MLREDFETFLELCRKENYSYSGMSTVGVSAYIHLNSHPSLSDISSLDTREVGPQLALNNATSNKPFTFGDHSAHCYESSHILEFFLALSTF